MIIKKGLSKKTNKTYYALLYKGVYITFDKLIIARLLNVHYTELPKLFVGVDTIELK